MPLLSEFPAELTDLILQHFARRLATSRAFLPLEQTIEDKNSLIPISLVCRYWAQRCRPYLLHELTMRSRRDLNELQSHLWHPGTAQPPLGRCLRILTVRLQSRWMFPWSHPLFASLRHWQGGLRPIVRVELDGFTGGGLPRTVPPLVASGVTHLCLKQTRLPRTAAFQRLLHSFPSLRSLECVGVDFGETSPIPMRRFVQLARVVFSGCTSVIPVFRTLLPIAREQTRISGVPDAVCDAIQQIAFLLLIERYAVGDLTYTCRPSVSIILGYIFEATLGTTSLSFIWESHSGARLTLAFGEGFGLDDAVSLNWNEIEDILLPLTGVSTIRLYVDDPDVFRWLLSVIPRGTHLRHLHRLRRVSIFYRMMPLRDLRYITHLSMHKKYPVVDRTVALSPAQTFDLLRIRAHRESE